jgi:hypothetical protein
VRLKRDILRKSSVGLIATNRSVTINGTGSNAVYGLDGAFAFFQNLTFDTYWAKTQTNGADRRRHELSRRVVVWRRPLRP